MQFVKSILFVVEPESEAAFARAVHEAKVNQARLILFDVQREVERTLPSLQLAIVQLREDRAQRLIQSADTEGVSIETKIVNGIPFLEIIKEVISGNHDLIVKSAEGRGGLGRWLFGTTDWHLMRKCPCPVWIVKMPKPRKLSCILAAVDPDPGVEANAALNDSILNIASSVAKQEGSELHVVHAWSVPSEDMLRSGRISMKRSDVDQIVQDTKLTHQGWLDNVLSQFDLTDEAVTKVHMHKGEPADVIPTVAEECKADLVVMGTVARTGIPGFFIGNTAEKTLSRLDCSVITVKPAGFESPVRV